jgi:hypothetical protein
MPLSSPDTAFNLPSSPALRALLNLSVSSSNAFDAVNSFLNVLSSPVASFNRLLSLEPPASFFHSIASLTAHLYLSISSVDAFNAIGSAFAFAYDSTSSFSSLLTIGSIALLLNTSIILISFVAPEIGLQV